MPKAIEAVWKIESTRLIAAIARVSHDIGIGEAPAGRRVPLPGSSAVQSVLAPLPNPQMQPTGRGGPERCAGARLPAAKQGKRLFVRAVR